MKDARTLEREALQWALGRGSRSGRVAFQFARDWAGRHRARPTAAAKRDRADCASPLTEVAAAVLIDRSGRFLLAQRPPGKVYAGYWEFPGGKVEPGEAPCRRARARAP